MKLLHFSILLSSMSMMIAEDNILPPVLAGDSNQQTGKGGYFQFYEDAYADDGGAGEVIIKKQINSHPILYYCILCLSVCLFISLSAISNMNFGQSVCLISSLTLKDFLSILLSVTKAFQRQYSLMNFLSFLLSVTIQITL